METTAPSTAQDDAWRERREGSLLWGRTRALLDELDELRAGAGAVSQPELIAAARQAVERERVVQMATAHTDKAEQRRQTLVNAVHRLLDAEGEPLFHPNYKPSHRVNVVVSRLSRNPTKYGLPTGWKSSDRKERRIRSAIESWSKSKF